MDTPSTNPEQVPKSGTTLSPLYTRFLEQVVLIGTTYSQKEGVGDQDIVRIFRTLSKPSRWKIINYFLEYGASSAWTLRYRLNIAKMTTYASLQELRALGFIQAKTTVKPFSKRKRPAIIWALPESTVEQVLKAVKLYERITNPIGLKAEDLGRRFIAKWDSERKNIEKNDIMGFIISENVPGHQRKDFFNWIAEILKAEGFKVWR